MTKLCFFVFFYASTLIFVSSSFISDSVKVVNFQKAADESDEYAFEYELEDGTVFHGKTTILAYKMPELHLIFGPDSVIYWIEFEDNAFENKTSISKDVRLAERGEDSLFMKDEFIEYTIKISKGSLSANPYQTTWDLEKICFLKCRNGTFNYTILAINNSRKFYGTTYINTNESNDPLVQFINLKDGSQRDDIYQVNFTNEELDSNEIFCRRTTKTIQQTGLLGAQVIANINSNALKSLVG